MKWTKEQEAAISSSKCNLLVSAAAGAGKTAILVEHIVNKVITEETDIDKILVVTFTRAAAKEMKERISKRLKEMWQEDPQNDRLRKQSILVESASIMTIDRFCLNLISNNIEHISINANFRIANEQELTLIQAEAIELVMEDNYQRKNPSFLDFVESYSGKYDDEYIKEMIINCHRMAMSYPFPDEWLENGIISYRVADISEMNKSPWMKSLICYIKNILIDNRERLDMALTLCKNSDGPYMYESSISADIILLDKLIAAADYEELSLVYKDIKFDRISSKKDENVNEIKKNTVKNIRDSVKKSITDIQKSYFFQSLQEMFDDIVASREKMEVLVNLVKQYKNCFWEMKSDKNVVDFADIEHLALNLLVTREENGNIIGTDIAKLYSQYYDEILIDEYQDSNQVQEDILNSISKEKDGNPNQFMVGDVKQSIYKFRMAKPELFLSKYERYKDTDSPYQKIELHKNFRSKENVVNSINTIFYQLMSQQVGGINYDNKAALKYGASYAKGSNEETELILIDAKENNVNDNDYSLKEYEAKALASKINQVVGVVDVVDKVTGCMRKAQYSDIVILLRTMTGWADEFSEELLKHNIPVHAETTTGYFASMEIKTILSLLKIIDNPIQDIPLTAVLFSPIAGLSERDLANVRILSPNSNMYYAVKKYAQDGTDVVLKDKISIFLNRLHSYRKMAIYLDINELLLQIYEDTGFYLYVQALNGGQQRKTNLDVLIQKAQQFGKTNYKGLYDFIKYIEKFDKYNMDYGEISSLGEKDNAVRIMSIHKSKGLEFPIVFLSGLAKKFNTQDSKEKIVVNSDLGAGSDYINLNERLKAPTLIKKAIQKQNHIEMLAEELRILYVALTRAKEKLFLTACVKDMDKVVSDWLDFRNSNLIGSGSMTFPYSEIVNADSYLSWLGKALSRHGYMDDILSKSGIITTAATLTSCMELRAEVINVDILVGNEAITQIEDAYDKKYFEEWENKVYDPELKSYMENIYNYVYPNLEDTKLHIKYSVTELKNNEIQSNSSFLKKESEEKERCIIDSVKSDRFMDVIDKESLLPECFRKEVKQVSAATVGIAIHRIMEKWNFLKMYSSLKEVKDEVDRITNETVFTEELKQKINIRSIYSFTQSNIYMRINKAAVNGKLFRESKFVLGVPANEVLKGYKSTSLVLIQGIIDIYFEEDGQLVICDYKTDKIDNKNEFIAKYKKQLDLYEMAAQRFYYCPVKEKILYSFSLAEEYVA